VWLPTISFDLFYSASPNFLSSPLAEGDLVVSASSLGSRSLISRRTLWSSPQILSETYGLRALKTYAIRKVQASTFLGLLSEFRDRRTIPSECYLTTFSFIFSLSKLESATGQKLGFSRPGRSTKTLSYSASCQKRLTCLRKFKTFIKFLREIDLSANFYLNLKSLWQTRLS